MDTARNFLSTKIELLENWQKFLFPISSLIEN